MQNKKIKFSTLLIVGLLLIGNPFVNRALAEGGVNLSTEFVLKDEMTRSEVSLPSNHIISFGTISGIATTGETITLTFQAGEFDLSDLDVGDIDLTDNVEQKTLDTVAGENIWGVAFGTDSIIFTAPVSGTGYIEALNVITVIIGTNATYNADPGVNQIKNPINAGIYQIDIAIQNSLPEEGQITLGIVDNDSITITGSNSAYINFDIDVGTGAGLAPEINCDYDECLTHSGGIAGGNYTVDFGELMFTTVNHSQTDNVLHADNQEGLINSIFFDLTTNASGGAVVSVKSLNGGLIGPGEANMINAVGVNGGADGNNILANTGRYGYTLQETPTALVGTVTRNALCITDTTFCGATTIAKTLFSTNDAQIEGARVRMDFAIAVAYTNAPGTYTDTLTFVATGTF
jgi:hypothetical protein